MDNLNDTICTMTTGEERNVFFTKQKIEILIRRIITTGTINTLGRLKKIKNTTGITDKCKLSVIICFFCWIDSKIVTIWEIIDQIILLESINALSSATTEREKEISPRAKRTE